MGDSMERWKRKSGKMPVTSGRLADIFDATLPKMKGIDYGQIKKARRVEQIRSMWRGLVSQVFLDHTNNVFVFTKDGRREMHVYVDESIFAAELNNQRELIKWQCLEKYGEQIDDFQIHVSIGKFKSVYPFRGDGVTPSVPTTECELDESDYEVVEAACSKITDPRLRNRFKKAMISDLKWKKSSEC